jgi:hypothetical protein
MEARSSMEKVNATTYGVINLIHRYINWVMIADSGTFRYKWDLDGYCDLYTPPNGDYTSVGVLSSGNRPRITDYDEFSFVVTGSDKKAFTHGNWYDWDINPPESAPTVAVGAAGSTTGTYTCYTTFLIKFPNGKEYETAPSPSGAVTTSSQKITWSNIPKSLYTGTGVKITRKLYRYSTGLGSIYYVTEIPDNTTTSYTDNETDATLITNDILSTAEYDCPPNGIHDVCEYLQRVFAIKDNWLYPSEPYQPFCFVAAEAIPVVKDGENLVGLCQWGDQLYICTTTTWFRLQGSDSSTWAVRNTFAEKGCVNKHTIRRTRYGIIGLWYDGIYVFDGTVAKNVTEKKIGTAFFDNITVNLCFGEWDGERYRFFYNDGTTYVNAVLIVDFSEYPEMKFYNDTFYPNAYEYHVPTGIRYIGNRDGFQYKSGGTEVISTELETREAICKNIFKQKGLQYLYYDINTNGKDVTVTFYVDDVAQSPVITLNEASRVRERLALASWQGYRISIKIVCADSSGLKIYEPWGIDYTPFGD